MKKLSKIFALALAVMLLCAYLAVPSAAVESKSAVVSIELSGERNVASDPSPKEMGWAGAAITIGDQDIVVTAVGRMYFTDGNISHAFLVVNEDGSLVREEPITVQGYDDSVDSTFEYYYFEKSEYLTLEAGKTYYLCSDFYGPLDKFYDASTVTTTEDLSFVGWVDLNLADGSWVFNEAPGINYLPVDIKYYIAGEEDTEPSTEATEPDETEPQQTKPAETKPAQTNPGTDPGNNDTETPAPSNTAGLWIGIAVAAVVVVIIVIVVLKKKKSK